MCLICGFIGCFASKNVPIEVEEAQTEISVTKIDVEQVGHIVDHYESSKHLYAQNLESQEVWDFTNVSATKVLAH